MGGHIQESFLGHLVYMMLPVLSARIFNFVSTREFVDGWIHFGGVAGSGSHLRTRFQCITSHVGCRLGFRLELSARCRVCAHSEKRKAKRRGRDVQDLHLVRQPSSRAPQLMDKLSSSASAKGLSAGCATAKIQILIQSSPDRTCSVYIRRSMAWRQEIAASLSRKASTQSLRRSTRL